MLKCDTCPRCKDVYPNKVNMYGYHYCICGMSGNIVYQVPRKEKKYSGSGWMHYSVSSCGLYESIDDALAHMTEPEIRRWKEDAENR